MTDDLCRPKVIQGDWQQAEAIALDLLAERPTATLPVSYQAQWSLVHKDRESK
jgi:hypothetical protein